MSKTFKSKNKWLNFPDPLFPFAGWSRGLVDYKTVDIRKKVLDKRQKVLDKRQIDPKKRKYISEARNASLADKKAGVYCTERKPKWSSLHNKHQRWYFTATLLGVKISAFFDSEQEAKQARDNVYFAFNDLARTKMISYNKVQKELSAHLKRVAREGFNRKAHKEIRKRVIDRQFF